MTRAGITGVILAGGRGRRMGDVDKGLLELHGRPLVAWVAERLAPQVDELLISANRNGERYAALGLRVVGDRIPGFAGPLAGLHAALEVAAHPLVVTVPCDSPFLPADLVLRLCSGLTATGAGVAVAWSGGRAHPVFCLCRRELQPHLAAYLASGERRVSGWHATLKVAEIAFDDEAERFANINTRDELGRFETGDPRA
jgi:molybdopterin-guanine dinucleotide biosynthesis protein A